MSLELAEMVMAIRDYACEDKQEWDRGVDFTVSDDQSDDKILLRVITEPTTKSGVISGNGINKMVEAMEQEQCDKGILVAEKFSAVARREGRDNSIKLISEKSPPAFGLQKIYLALRDQVDYLCTTKCGQIPKKKSDCKGYSEEGYSCEVRRISDNGSFHLERGWTRLLQRDLVRLLRVHSSLPT